MAEIERKVEGTHTGISEENHGEAREAEIRWEVGDDQGRISVGVSVSQSDMNCICR